MGRLARRLVAVALTAFFVGGTADAAEPTIVVENGKTAPAFGYSDAIRERVFIPLPGVDQDMDGLADRTAIDIIRPKATNEGLKAPAIIDPSPYYTTLGRGHEGQLIADLDGDGLNDRWPLFYDNYFVPRGYAVILAHMDGTGFSTGCPMHGGPGDIASMKAVVDWLNGRVPGFDKDGNAVTAPWHNGKAAMIGKSYDGTLSNGVAATGVDGLTTIVPISAISNWYDYSRMGGIRFNTNYPGNSLGNTVTNPDRRAFCEPSRTLMNNTDGDEHGDINQFWIDRDHLKDIANVKAAVFATHGFQDDNVRMNHVSKWWDALEASGVPRKMWLTRTGHEDPFDFRRTEWVDTLHRWFDHWLQGLDNGIMNEPRVDLERGAHEWETASDWPVPGTVETDVYLQGTGPDSAGTLGGSSGGATDTLTWTDAAQSENTMINAPDGAQTNRQVFLSPVLTKPLRISGTPVIDIQASLSTDQSNLGAVIVDYGPSSQPFTQVSRTNDGIADANPPTPTCWGESTPNDSACYKSVQTLTTSVTQWRVSKGILDSSNRESLLAPTLATPGVNYRFTFPTLPNDVVFAAGHRIGIILVANYTQYGSVAGTAGSTITLDSKLSKVRLPIVGGYAAAAGAGAFVAETVAPVLAGVPNDIAVETESGDGIAVSFPLPTATDNEDPNPAVACTPASGARFGVGTTTVTCTATDAHGNSASDTFDVTVTLIDEDDGDVGGEVPATLNLSVAGPASFGAFKPGLAQDYFTTLAAVVTSTAADAALSVTDAAGDGRLANGAFLLAQPLQARAASATSPGGDYAAVGGTPTPLLSYGGPVSNDQVTVGLKQSIGSTEPLRTGTYSKTLTFTLSTTTP